MTDNPTRIDPGTKVASDTSVFQWPDVTASVSGKPAVEVDGGQITLDSMAVPYATADVELPLDDSTLLDDLDPRDNVRVTVAGKSLPGATPRTFDLGLRTRALDETGKVVRVSLASDEALLQDYAVLANDSTPLTMQNSLRSVCNYVLNKVIPGASLAAGTDAPIPALAATTNLIRNPRVANNSTDWYSTYASGGLAFTRYTTGGPSYAPAYMQMYSNVSASTAGAYAYIDNSVVPVSGGDTYEWSIDANHAAGLSVSLDVMWLAGGAGLSYSNRATFVGTGAWQRLKIQVTAPPGATNVRPRLVIDGTFTYGAYFGITAARFSRATGDRANDGLYFDGDTADTASYDYSWAQNPHASFSNRNVVPATSANPASLVWSAGVYAWDFLSPLCNVAGMRLFCDEKRVWRLVVPASYAVEGTITLSPYNSVLSLDTISRDNPEVFATGVVVRYVWQTPGGGTTLTAIDVAGTPGRVAVVDYQRPYPGPGAAAAILARRNGTGRSQELTALIQWLATPGQNATISMPHSPTLQGKVAIIRFDLTDDGLMDVGTLGLIDIPANSWLAVPKGEKWTDPPTPLSWNDWT